MRYDHTITLNKDKQRRLAFIMLDQYYTDSNPQEVMEAIDSLSMVSVKKLVNILSLGNRGNSTHNVLERLLTLEAKDFQKWLGIASRNAKFAYKVQEGTDSDHVDLVDSILWHSRSRSLTVRQEKNITLATAAALSVFKDDFSLFTKGDLAYAKIPVGVFKSSPTLENVVLERDGTFLHHETMVLSSQPLIDYVLKHKGKSEELYQAITVGQSISPARIAAIISSGVQVTPLLDGAL